jgi:hypothetical protein
MSNIAKLDDGFSVQENLSSSYIQGKMLKFIDGRFVVDKAEELPTDSTLVALNVITCWVHWENGKPIDHRVTQPGQQHPDRDELPDQDESLWPPGLNGEPEDVWKDTRYLHLIDPQTGADFTFVTDSYGGRRGVGNLKSQIYYVRMAHPAALPVVQLASAPMKTRFGLKKRPEFKVVGWRGRQQRAAVQAIEEKPCEPQKEFVEPLDDDIPF